MAKALRQFFQRAPRYVLNASDNRILRFARDRVPGQSFTTEILNLSESGMSFTVDRAHAPQLGEVIKVEFSAPGDESLAWFARVVRLELPSEYAAWKAHSDEVRIAVRFESLPDGHQQLLRKQLREKFEQLQFERRIRNIKRARSWIYTHRYLLLMYFLATLGTLSMLYILSRPSANYDESNPSIWGERFSK